MYLGSRWVDTADHEAQAQVGKVQQGVLIAVGVNGNHDVRSEATACLTA